VLNVALEAFPVPSDETSWMDILEFKHETSNKQWCFRRFLKKLISTKQAEREVRDEIEWLIHGYSEAMRIHKINPR
jgi:hypothetical protein